MSHSDIHGRPYSGIVGLFASLKTGTLGFDSRHVHVPIQLFKETSGPVSLEELRFFPVRIFLQILCILTESSCHQRYMMSATESFLKCQASLPPMHGIKDKFRKIVRKSN